MKITKRQLKKIIREEKATLLNEVAFSPMKSRADPEFAAIIKGQHFIQESMGGRIYGILSDLKNIPDYMYESSSMNEDDVAGLAIYIDEFIEGLRGRIKGSGLIGF